MKMQTGRWTIDEKTSFNRIYPQYKDNLRQILRFVPTRTLLQIRSHTQKYLQKQEKENQLKANLALLSDPNGSVYGVNTRRMVHDNAQKLKRKSNNKREKVFRSSQRKVRRGLKKIRKAEKLTGQRLRNMAQSDTPKGSFRRKSHAHSIVANGTCRKTLKKHANS